MERLLNEPKPVRTGRTRLLIVSVVVVSLVSGCAQLYPNENIAATIEFWQPEITGDVALDRGAISGTLVDFDDDLDIDRETTYVFQGRIQAGGVVLEGRYFDTEYNSDTLRQTITFGGQTFTANLPVDSSLDLEFASLRAKLGIASLGPVAVGAILGANYYNFRGRISALGLSAQETLEAPFPIVGAVVTVHQPLNEHVAVLGELALTGLEVDAFDIDGHYYEGMARAGVQLSHIKAGVGYRLIDVDVEDKDDDFVWDFRLGGFIIFGEIAF